MQNVNIQNVYPLAKARAMSRRTECGSAVKKKTEQLHKRMLVVNLTNVKTFAPKRQKAMGGGFMARRATYV